MWIQSMRMFARSTFRYVIELDQGVCEQVSTQGAEHIDSEEMGGELPILHRQADVVLGQVGSDGEIGTGSST